MKVHFLYKVMAFAASVMTLSGFFAGYRAIHEGTSLSHWALLIGSTAATILLLGLQGYWIYIEEKAKGSLKKRIGVYEWIYSAWQARTGAPVIQQSVSGSNQHERGIEKA